MMTISDIERSETTRFESKMRAGRLKALLLAGVVVPAMVLAPMSASVAQEPGPRGGMRDGGPGGGMRGPGGGEGGARAPRGEGGGMRGEGGPGGGGGQRGGSEGDV